MQTILGSGGAVAIPLAKQLKQHTDRIRLVSRTPTRVHTDDELFPANLLDAAQIDAAVKGSEVVYLTAGLTYKSSIWQEQWPRIMTNVLNACKNHQARLVFFDNVYMYGLVHGPMTEDTPYNPVSKKGEIRARIAQQLMEETKAGNLQALIARAPDFYGPNVATSVVSATVVDNLKKGKKPQWFCNGNLKHSLIYTPDAGISTALLGNSLEAYGQIWHLPTAALALTGAELISLFAKEMGTSDAYMTIPKWMVSGLGLFVSILKESVEMLYQYDHEYLFDSQKFEKAFNFRPTSYEEGVRMIVEAERPY